MNEKLHWEWRGFGAVQSTFANRYCSLPAVSPSETVRDLYLWKKNLNINIKLRKGAEDGLKFKRFKTKHKAFEQWLEDPTEVFPFPLGDTAWDTLEKELESKVESFPAKPNAPLTRSKTLQRLQQTGCQIVKVKKIRESRLINISGGTVKVEWCCITLPQSIISIGLENWPEDGNNTLTDEEIIFNLQKAIEVLELNEQPLEEMNYLGALDYWANDKKI